MLHGQGPLRARAARQQGQGTSTGRIASVPALSDGAIRVVTSIVYDADSVASRRSS